MCIVAVRYPRWIENTAIGYGDVVCTETKAISIIQEIKRNTKKKGTRNATTIKCLFYLPIIINRSFSK